MTESASEGEPIADCHSCGSRTVGCANCAEARVCEQQRSCSPGFRRKEMHMPPKREGAVSGGSPSAAQVEGSRHPTDERVGVFTPDKDGDTHTSCGRAAVLAARRGRTVCGEVGRVPRFPQLTVHEGASVSRSSAHAAPPWASSHRSAVKWLRQ